MSKRENVTDINIIIVITLISRCVGKISHSKCVYLSWINDCIFVDLLFFYLLYNIYYL